MECDGPCGKRGEPAMRETGRVARERRWEHDGAAVRPDWTGVIEEGGGISGNDSHQGGGDRGRIGRGEKQCSRIRRRRSRRRRRSKISFPQIETMYSRIQIERLRTVHHPVAVVSPRAPPRRRGAVAPTIPVRRWSANRHQRVVFYLPVEGESRPRTAFGRRFLAPCCRMVVRGSSLPGLALPPRRRMRKSVG